MNRHLEKPLYKKVLIFSMKLLALLVLTGVVFYSHMVAYDSGYQRGGNRGASNVANYVYAVCNHDEQNDLLLYGKHFHCSKLGSL